MKILNINEILEENQKLKKQIKDLKKEKKILEHCVLVLEIKLRNLSEFFVEVEGQIREQDLKNVINNLINQYIKRGYTEEEISLMTFYRYPTKVKK